MTSVIEPLYKSKDKIQFAWKQEPGAVSYKMYVGVTPTVTTLVSLYTKISNQVSQVPISLGKVTYDALATDVVTALSLAATTDFSNKVFYFTITFVNSLGAESARASSTVVEVPPVGITSRFMKDDPTINRHPFVFSDGLQRWVKTAGSSSGGLVVDTCDYYKANITTDYTYDGTNIKTTRSYLSDATTGSPAKLTAYTYVGSSLTKIQITDSTV